MRSLLLIAIVAVSCAGCAGLFCAPACRSRGELLGALALVLWIRRRTLRSARLAPSADVGVAT